MVAEREGVAREGWAAVFARVGDLLFRPPALVLLLGELALRAFLEYRELGGSLGELGGERREARFQLAARHAGVGRNLRLGGRRIGPRIVRRRVRGTAVRGFFV